MDSNDSGLRYTAPQLAAEQYAARAIRHLKAWERFDARLLAYLLAPATVLALAGLRSVSPYNDRLRFAVDTARFNKLMTQQGLLWMDEHPNTAKPVLASYALVNLDMVDQVHKVYPLPAVTGNGVVPERSPWGFFAWQAGLDIALARAMEDGTLPRAWLADWWSPMNVRFGMLLGYPGAAIASFVEAEMSEQRRQAMTDVMISPGLFNSAAVAFAIDKRERDRPDVSHTITTWQATLDLVYQTYPPEVLLTDPEFKAAVQAKV